MKKLSMIILSIFTVSVTSSCSKENFIKPSKAQAIFATDKAELGIGD